MTDKFDWILKDKFDENSKPFNYIKMDEILNQQNSSSREYPLLDSVLSKETNTLNFDEILKGVNFTTPSTSPPAQKPKADKSVALEILEMYGLPTKKGGWWVKHPVRAAEEITIMNDNTNANLRCENELLIWSEWITTNFGKEYLINIEAKNFPFVMPKVYLLTPKIPRKFRKHIWNDGSLCIMYPQDFNSKMSILQIRNQTAAWCFCHEALKQIKVWVGD